MVKTYLVALACVVGIAIGQLLFKLSANSLQKTGSLFAPETAVTLIVAFVLYGVTTLAWVWVLQKASLGRIYPLMALAFVIVPLASHYLFGEPLERQYWLGILMIVAGIVLVLKS